MYGDKHPAEVGRQVKILRSLIPPGRECIRLCKNILEFYRWVKFLLSLLKGRQSLYQILQEGITIYI